MDSADLQSGFRLGEWLVEPARARLSGPRGEYTLEPVQLALLLCLAGRHGEAVARSELRQCVAPNGDDADPLLRDAVRNLRELLGSSAHDRHYIASVGTGEYALVAHFEPVARQPAALLLAQSSATHAPVSSGTLVGRLQHFVAELRRRSVLKVCSAYLVGMWLVLQVAETTFESLFLPGWWMTALTILTVLGLPIVTVLAWSYEITPSGIVLEEDAPGVLKLPRARRAIAPVAVTGVVLMAAITGVAWWRSIDVPGPAADAMTDPGYPSVAVLPLVDMSPAGGNSYLGDGLSEELSTRLAQIPGLRVAARTSSFEFKGQNLDVRRIGQSLGVRHVLEGSVRRVEDDVRVSVQLIDALSGYHVWAGNYDRSWRDVIALQDDIARAVTEALSIVLVPESKAATPLTVDTRAFDPYLAGLAHLRQSGDMSRLEEAGRRFEEAIRIDPSFARAHAGLCRVGVRIYDRTRDPAYVSRAEQSCQQALQLDPALVETEKALGALYLASGRFAEAETEFRALVERNPRDADGHIGLGRALAAAGGFEAAEASFRAGVQAEPGYWGAFNALGSFLFARGDVGEAVAAFREVAELVPSSASAYNNLGAALQLSGDLEGAATAFRRSLAIEPSRGAYSNLGTVYYFLKDYEQAAANYERATALADQDHILWGNLGDALWQIPGRRAEAVGHYRRASVLARRELESNPEQGILLSQLGYYQGRIGDVDASQAYLRQAAGTPESPYRSYYAAVAAADRGDSAEARRAALEALRLGYPESLLRADPSLAGIDLARPPG